MRCTVFDAFVNHLMGWPAVDGIKNIPLPQAFKRIVGWQYSFDPKLNVAPGWRVHITASKVLAPHAFRSPFPGDDGLRLAPGFAVIGGTAEVGDVDCIGAAPALFQRGHGTAAFGCAVSIAHHGSAFAG